MDHSKSGGEKTKPVVKREAGFLSVQFHALLASASPINSVSLSIRGLLPANSKQHTHEESTEVLKESTLSLAESTGAGGNLPSGGDVVRQTAV